MKRNVKRKSSGIEYEKMRFLRQGDTIRKKIITLHGRLWLSQAISRPIQRKLDYARIGRKTFGAKPLPPGSLPIYDKGIGFYNEKK